jgi:ATP-dependent DNA helicase RecQ
MDEALTPLTILRERFGLNDFRPGQLPVIESLLAGHSAAAVFPTGAGKSLCYQLPALTLPGITLIVSPLIALMKDQVDSLQRRGIPAARLDSSCTAAEVGQLFTDLRQGILKILFVAPERFNNERFRESLRGIQVSLFAVDEAHCISEWGHNFRPDYLKLPFAAQACGAERILALTATATPEVLDDICRGFGIAQEHAFRTGFYRANLTLLMTPTTDSERLELLKQRLQSRPRGATIVYVSLQKTAEAVAEQLTAAGWEARPYHAGLNDELRATTQDWFIQHDQAVIVATIAFGMGIDKANIRYVYHYNVAKSLENLSQEIGRAGRDGQPSICESFVVTDDATVLENFIYGDTPSATAIESLLTDLFQRDENFEVSLYDLSARHDLRPLVLRTLLTYLELQGYLLEGTPIYAEYQFKPIKSSAQILAEFSGERRDFLKNIFSCAVKKQTWCYLDLVQVEQHTQAPRERIVRALNYLSEQGWLELQVSGLRNRYQRLQTPSSIRALATQLYEKSLQREAKELHRLQQVFDLTTEPGCQSARLARHFGEALGDDFRCEHCSFCQGAYHSSELTERVQVQLSQRDWQAILRLRQEQGAFQDARLLAKFLCGLTSPALSKLKLSKHQLFGVLEHAPYAKVLERLTAASSSATVVS